MNAGTIIRARGARTCPRMSRVLITSSGVVTAAAMAPAKEPQAAACTGETGAPCSRAQRRLEAS